MMERCCGSRRNQYEVMLNGEQRRRLRQFAGSARYVFNRALAIHYQEREQTGRKQSGYAALCRMLSRLGIGA
jgi:putative transposase